MAALPCPLWVSSRHFGMSARCPLFPRKRTSAHAIRMSALGQTATFCGATFLLFVAANLIRGIRYFLLVCTKLASDNSCSGDVDKS
jgi:hypothetical protein